MALKPTTEEEEEPPVQAPAALSSHTQDAEALIWDKVAVPSIADPTEQRTMTPKSLLDCCRCAQEYVDEHDLADGLDIGELNLMSVLGHRTSSPIFKSRLDSRIKSYPLRLVNLLRLVCYMTREAGLESVLSAAFSLKHETDMKKSFASLAEAQDKAKQMRLTRDQADKCIHETPSGRFALCDTTRGEHVRPDDFKSRCSFLDSSHTHCEQGRSEVSCVFESVHPELLRARPMILTDDTRPSHFTFANQVGVQTDDSTDTTPMDTTDELRQTIASYLLLTNLEISAGITPAMSLYATLPRDPHPDGPTRMMMEQLADAQYQLHREQQEQNISRILKGVVTNMHCLAKFSREAGLVQYLGQPQESNHNLESVWPLQVDLDKQMPKACALALTPSL